MDTKFELSNNVGSLRNLIIYGFISIFSIILVFIYGSYDVFYSGTIIFFLIAFFFVVIVFSELSEMSKNIIIIPGTIMVTSLLNEETIHFEDITTASFQFSEEAVGFSRMRLLGTFSKSSLPTYFTFEIETDEFVIKDSLKKIEPEQAEEFISAFRDLTGFNPKTSQITTEEQRASLFVFDFSNFDDQLDDSDKYT